MIYLYHSFHVPRLLLNISWLIVRKEIEQQQKDGINLTEIFLEGENEHKFSSNLIKVVYLEN